MNRKIEVLEFNSLLYFVLRASYIGITITNLVVLTKVDSYLCPLIGCLVGLLFLIFYFKISKIDKSKNIVENIQTCFGKKLGTFINLILCFFVFSFIIILFCILRNKWRLIHKKNY